VIVVDASVVAPALVDDTAHGDAVRQRLRGERLAAPEIVDLEVVSVLRRLRSRGLPERRAQQALDDLRQLPLARAGHRPLLSRCWQLRDSLTPYDAAYVALAEALTATLLTGDSRLAHASGIRCPVELW
jgi:predicted nucleic acid-binding protein